MSGDLVRRLREGVERGDDWGHQGENERLLKEAADEIERLRKEVSELEAARRLCDRCAPDPQESE